jgi:6-pyruvoyl-tetrahydropterin synthase
MYSLCVRDHIMIAHSFQGEIFGPAQQLHGATYVVDCELRRPELDADGLVVDIGKASMVLRELLAEFDYRNLDEHAAFKGQNTTTEFLARAIFDRFADRIAGGDLGESAKGLTALRVQLSESHVAWAAYEGELPAQGEDQSQDLRSADQGAAGI